MAASTFGVTVPEQCALATTHLPGAANCCSDGSTAACNQALDAAAVPALYRSINLVADALAPTGGAVTETMLRTALGAGLALALLDLGSAFHFVLVQSVAQQHYTLADPKYNMPVVVTWNDLSTAYGNGKLAQAWQLKSAG